MAKFSAQEIYSLLSEHSLTDEQRMVIEDATLDDPALVVAGAGSGKTELMTLRVLYLVANGFAKPAEILGLTFTRKAASELAGRVNQALYKLRESKYWPADLEQDFTPASITTYNSFGNDIFRRMSLSLGFEQDATLLTEASAIALADELVSSLGLDQVFGLEDWEKTKGHLVDLVLQLSSEMTDHQTSFDAIRDSLQEFVDFVSALPQNDKGSMERYSYTQEMLQAATQNQMLADIAARYRELKLNRNLVDFSDQVALALGAVGDGFIHDYRFVLLDEYQDTSSIQTKLLSKLFYGLPVLAVGDPNQAIYGWRGASSNNLAGFHQDFGSRKRQNFSLSKSWRSGPNVVRAANLMTAELAKSEPDLTPIELLPGNPNKSDSVTAEVFQDEFEEAKAVAAWFGKNLAQDKSAALLLRTKASMQLYADEISSLGIQVEVTGLSSLAQMPEVMDLISALNVVERMDSGAHLMRVLAGPRYRIAPKDLAALNRLAQTLGRFAGEGGKSVPVTIIEALDSLRFESNQDLVSFSTAGLDRLKAASALFHNLRLKTSMNIGEICWAVVRELELDIELYAHSDSPNPLANLESFIARLTEYEQGAIRPSLASMLNWLDQALARESFELPKSGAKNGVVQIMSVHAAKGLEWDLVAISQLNHGSFPIEGRSAKGWLSAGKIPFALRGDAEVLPRFAYTRASTQRELKARYEEFQQSNRDRALLEERRLAYVAFTRARQQLFLTASHFKLGNKKARALSGFLQELIAAGAVQLVREVPQPLENNPLEQHAVTKTWPFDPLGSGRERVQLAADEVIKTPPVSLDDFTELMLLLDEKERASWATPPLLPLRLSASKLMQLINDPKAFADWISRPLPQLYTESSDLGTGFHAQIEEFFAASNQGEDYNWDGDYEQVVNFQGSRFSSLEPVFVEQGIEFELAGMVVVCKLDAVFETEFGYQIVDWKSGSSPKDNSELDTRAIQLALYRIALSKWLKIPIERIQSSFYFAKDGREITPARLMSEAEIAQAIESVRTTRQ